MNALNRLNQYRENAARMTEAYKKHGIVHNWKQHRYPKLFTRQERTNYAESWDDAPFKFEDYADQLANISHTGWYVDDDGVLGTLRGVVLSFRNPHKLNDRDEGHRFYVAGTEHSEWGNCTYYPGDIYDNKRSAAYAADSIAEREAGKECDYQREDQAQQDKERAREDIHTLNKTTLALIKEVKAADPFTPAICAALKSSIEDLLQERAKLWKRIEA